MNIYNLIVTLLITLLITGCNNPHEPDPRSQQTTYPLSLQNLTTDIFTTNHIDYRRQYTYTNDNSNDQSLTLRVSSVNSPLGGGINSAIKTELRTSFGRVIEIADVLPTDTVWKDFELKKNESLELTLSVYGTFRDEFYEFEIELLPGANNGLTVDDDTFEPNNTTNIATSINLNSKISSELITGSVDQSDVFKLNLEDGITYSLLATNSQGPSSSTIGGLRFLITDSNNNPAVPSFDLKQAMGSNFEFKVKTSGAYYLKISSPHGTIYQNDYYSYEFSIWEPRTNWDNPDYEPNETPSLAYEIDVNQAINSQLTKGPRDYEDNYLLKLYPGTRHKLSITASNGPNRSFLSNLRFIITDDSGGVVFTPEQSVAVGQTKNLEMSVNTRTNAVIKIYYVPTSGHEQDFHAYTIVAEVI